MSGERMTDEEFEALAGCAGNRDPNEFDCLAEETRRARAAEQQLRALLTEEMQASLQKAKAQNKFDHGLVEHLDKLASERDALRAQLATLKTTLEQMQMGQAHAGNAGAVRLIERILALLSTDTREVKP